MQAQTADRLQKAQKYLAAGKADRAETICRKLLKSKDGYVDIRLTLSKALLAQDKPDQALKYLSEAANHQPDKLALQSATGDLAFRIKKYAEAIDHYQKAVSLEPSNPDYWYRLSDALFQAATENFKSYLDRGEVTQSGETKPRVDFYDDAIAISNKAIELFSEDVPLLRLAGEILLKAGIEDVAMLCFERCLPLDPFDHIAHYHWLEYKRSKNANQEIVDYAIAQGDRIANDAICNRTVTYAYAQLGRYDKAMEHINRSVELAPKNDKFVTAKAHIYYRLGQFEKSITYSNKALQLNPEATYPHWLNCLSNWKLGNLPEAHKCNPYRFEVADVCTKFNLKSPLWRGESLEDKRIYVWSDQGIGDIFKTTSMLREITPHENVIVAVQDKCMPFIKALFPRIDVRPLPTKLPALSIVSNAFGTKQSRKNEFPSIEEDFDCQIPLGSLIEVLRPEVSDFEGKDKIMILPEEHVAPFRALNILSNPNTTKVGMAWSSKTFGDPEAYGYLELEELLDVLRMPGFEFYNFQYTTKEHEITAFREKHDVPLYHAPGLDLMDDMLETAAFNSCMDLFVGPGSTSSDIAGAVGIKCLRYAPCHYQDNLGQPYVPWFADQKSIDIPWGDDALNYIDVIKQWLLDNKKH
ncbi:tetratricopeptide repeat protein [Cohaesibacter intestini]|uniref:tetratricopeptide repeat protein n=1 Tax=Cohaesibacter intestini TaxID=2211145 RepID=UPI000DEA9FEC|nr:tetratricopeptide repeat protein [Cohaesibacter intestini]